MAFRVDSRDSLVLLQQQEEGVIQWPVEPQQQVRPAPGGNQLLQQQGEEREQQQQQTDHQVICYALLQRKVLPLDFTSIA